MPYRFFTSYAHKDASDDEGLLRTFYFDLAKELKRTMEEAGEDEFLDVKNIGSGAEWRGKLEEGLLSTRSFLAFYSPAYFNSPDCGKEVTAFRERLKQFKNDPQNAGKTPELLLGVLWESELSIRDKVPPSLGGLQFGVQHFQEQPLKGEKKALDRTDDVSKQEKLYGLRFIMQKKASGSNQDALAYWDIVNRYASQIRFATKQYDLSKYPFAGDYKSLTPAFPIQHLGNEPPPPATGGYGIGPKFVKVIFVVGGPDVFQQLQERKNLASYDKDPRLWRPFYPDDEDDIATIVNGAIRSEKAIADWVLGATELDSATFMQHVETAANNNNVLVVLIDPWSVFIPNLQAGLSALDKRRNAYAAMFVCWNDEDKETAGKAQELQNELETAFYETTSENQSWVPDITYRTPKDLEDKLSTAVTIIKKRIFDRLAKQGRVRNLPPGSPLPNAPVPSR